MSPISPPRSCATIPAGALPRPANASPPAARAWSIPWSAALQTSSATVSSLDARLHSLSPLAVLDRGYALVLAAEGGLIRSTAQIAPATSSDDQAFIDAPHRRRQSTQKIAAV